MRTSKATPVGLQAVYEKYRHLDHLLRDSACMPATLQGEMLRECWIAICAAVAAREAL